MVYKGIREPIVKVGEGTGIHIFMFFLFFDKYLPSQICIYIYIYILIILYYFISSIINIDSLL